MRNAGLEEAQAGIKIARENISFHSNPKKGAVKESSNYHTIELISHTLQSIAQNSPSQASAIHEP